MSKCVAGLSTEALQATDPKTCTRDGGRRDNFRPYSAISGAYVIEGTNRQAADHALFAAISPSLLACLEADACSQ
jgi:hypothetical protein